RLRRNSASLPIAYLAQGMAGKLMEEWDEAESSLRRAIRIYERENRLEEAAYGWYILASVFSVAGQYDAALSALWTAIDLDRRAENGFGLTSSYQAMTAVLDKAGRTEEAQEARTRAEEIHRALFYGQAGEAGARD
ncbi:MAG: hypothetical protein FWH12_08010, partial [Treponema sp.]|nr:hypothetical protein [Treponema sp.]